MGHLEKSEKDLGKCLEENQKVIKSILYPYKENEPIECSFREIWKRDSIHYGIKSKEFLKVNDIMSTCAYKLYFNEDEIVGVALLGRSSKANFINLNEKFPFSIKLKLDLDLPINKKDLIIL